MHSVIRTSFDNSLSLDKVNCLSSSLFCPSMHIPFPLSSLTSLRADRHFPFGLTYCIGEHNTWSSHNGLLARSCCPYPCLFRLGQCTKRMVKAQRATLSDESPCLSKQLIRASPRLRELSKLCQNYGMLKTTRL